MKNPEYSFTDAQLATLLNSTIEMFFEYRDQHGKDEEQAQACAVREMFEGLDAEMEMFRNRDKQFLTLQKGYVDSL